MDNIKNLRIFGESVHVSPFTQGKGIKEIAESIGYGYPTVAKSISHLQQLGLVQEEISESGLKTIHFSYIGRNLWDRIQPYVIDPVKKRLYVNSQMLAGLTGGINALSHYTLLAPDVLDTKVLSLVDFKEFEKNTIIDLGLNEHEGLQPIEIWKYRPIPLSAGCVDPLSLALSLREDRDHRVEKEIENMINKLQW